MSPARKITRSSLLEAQKTMILHCESRGVDRVLLSKTTGDPRSAYDNAMREAAVLLGSDRMARLLYVAVSLGFERVHDLPETHAVCPLPDVPSNGSTDDEILDGAEIIGRTRFDALRGDWQAVLAYGWLLIQVGWRLVIEAKRKLGHTVVPLRTYAMPAPLFEYSGDGM